MRLRLRQLVAALLLGGFALLAPSLVAHGHGGTTLVPDLACAKCALAYGSAPAAAPTDLAEAPLAVGEPAPVAVVPLPVCAPRAAAVSRGPPAASL
jgi:hypothetical protein